MNFLYIEKNNLIYKKYLNVLIVIIIMLKDDNVIVIYIKLCKEMYPFFYICFQILYLFYEILIQSKNSLIKISKYVCNEDNFIKLNVPFDKVKKYLKPLNINFEELFNELFNKYFKKDNKTIVNKTALKEDKLHDFILKYDSLYSKDRCNSNNNNIQNCYLLCNTPLGNVIILYKDDFIYYSNFSIPHRCLDAIGKKYVYTFACSHLYNWEDTSNENNTNEEDKNPENVKEDSKEGIYLKFKNNIVLNNKSHNKFKYMGKLNDFNFLQPIENNNKEEKEVNYEDFKKLINSKRET